MSSQIILCVDDEKIVTDALLSQLRATYGKDYRYEAASDVDEAWEILEEIEEEGDRLCLVISDWLMPRVKGDEFLREVYGKDPSIPLIMLSGQADESAVDGLRELVAEFVFVRKPWDKDELMEQVSLMLQKHLLA